MASLEALLRAYKLQAGDVVYVDTGSYTQLYDIVFGAEDSGSATAAADRVRIQGPTGAAQAVLNRDATGVDSAVFRFTGADFVTLSDLEMTGARVGVLFAYQAARTISRSSTARFMRTPTQASASTPRAVDSSTAISKLAAPASSTMPTDTGSTPISRQAISTFTTARSSAIFTACNFTARRLRRRRSSIPSSGTTNTVPMSMPMTAGCSSVATALPTTGTSVLKFSAARFATTSFRARRPTPTALVFGPAIPATGPQSKTIRCSTTRRVLYRPAMRSSTGTASSAIRRAGCGSTVRTSRSRPTVSIRTSSAFPPPIRRSMPGLCRT